jgi:hypothetical protein
MTKQWVSKFFIEKMLLCRTPKPRAIGNERSKGVSLTLYTRVSNRTCSDHRGEVRTGICLLRHSFPGVESCQLSSQL